MAGPEVPFPLSIPPGTNDTPGHLPNIRGGFDWPHGGSGGPGIFPFPGLPGLLRRDGAPQGPGYKAARGRAKYKAHRVGTMLTIEASGTLGYAAQIADLRQSSNLIFPPQFEFIVYTPDGMINPVTRDFAFSESFGFPETADVVVVLDADGAHPVEIEAAPAALANFVAVTAGQSAIGYGGSLQDAFDNAVSELPTHGAVADDFLTYTIESSGLIAGGFANLRKYFAKVSFAESADGGPAAPAAAVDGAA